MDVYTTGRGLFVREVARLSELGRNSARGLGMRVARNSSLKQLLLCGKFKFANVSSRAISRRLSLGIVMSEDIQF
jgi:hypothetical protein